MSIKDGEIMTISTYRKIWSHTELKFPEFSGTRIMMMPVKLGWFYGVPQKYVGLLSHLYEYMEYRFRNEIGYLTIDERELLTSETLRNPGLHVDGYYHGKCGAWGGGGGWGSVGNGMLVTSNTRHCSSFIGSYEGEPGPEGECEHLKMNGSFDKFEANQVYWVDGNCIHESLPVKTRTKRQFVRLSMPSNGPWFDGYTKNPTGLINPTGKILPKRKF